MRQNENLTNRTKKLLVDVFGGPEVVAGNDSQHVLMTGGSGTVSPHTELLRMMAGEGNNRDKDKGDSFKEAEDLPVEQRARFPYYSKMACDPIVGNALTVHIQSALSSSANSKNAIFIESKDGSKDKIVEDLSNTFTEMINQNAQLWASQMCIFGRFYTRPYLGTSKSTAGVRQLQSDYYTLPHLIREYEKGGKLVGFIHDHQFNAKADRSTMNLLEPWMFVGFKYPTTEIPLIEPLRVNGDAYDITRDNIYDDIPVETSNYGTSLLENCWESYFNLKEAIISINLARRNAGKKERFVGVSLGRDTITQAAEYIKTLTTLLNRKKSASASRALSKGYVQSTENIIYPIAGDGGGNINIDQMDNSVDIAHIEDINFHVSRLASNLKIDKSLLGFTDDMAGGLGEGGYLRMSIQAASVANKIRIGLDGGLDRLFRIHCAAKFNKVFPPGQEPWKITYNALSTAIERETSEARERAASQAAQLVAILQQIDPEMQGIDKQRLTNWIFTTLLNFEEAEFNSFMGATPANASGKTNDSAFDANIASLIQDEIRAAKFYNRNS